MKQHLSIFVLASIAVFSFTVLPASAAAPALTAAELSLLTQSKNLQVGSYGNEVSLLQRVLIADGELSASLFPGGNPSGYFGAQTRIALRQYQSAHGIYPATGAFGPLTRAALKSIATITPAAPVKPTTPQPVYALPQVPDTDVAMSTSLAADNFSYLTDIGNVAQNVRFTMDDLTTMQAANKEVSPVPTLIAKLQMDLTKGDAAAVAQDRAALSSWQRYFDNGYRALAAAPVNPAHAAGRRAMLGWFKYNSGFLSTYAAASDTSSLAAANTTYQTIFDKNRSVIQSGMEMPSSLSQQTSWAKRLLSFAAPLRALASEPHFLPVGGSISITDTCTTGELLSIKGSAGGQYFLYWVVLTYNPFAYKKVSNGNQILGSAIPGPGVCNKGYLTYPEGWGFIGFFGTS